MVTLRTNFGNIRIHLNADKTPNSVANFLAYAKSGFYDGTLFHRVINGFMIQAGGFSKGMTPKPPLFSPIFNEAKSSEKNRRGTLAYARTYEAHSATSQFLINVVDNPFLDHISETKTGWGYCVFGYVIKGMEVVDRIRQVATTTRLGYSDVPIDDIIIEKVDLPVFQTSPKFEALL